MFDNEIRVQHLVEDITSEWYHVSSEDNSADRTTRLHSVPEDFGLDSEWMTGPAFLKLLVEKWPVNRNFADRKSNVKLPVEEIRKWYRDQLGCLVQVGAGQHLGSTSAMGPGNLDNPILEHFDFGRRTNDWRRLVRSTSYLFMWYVRVAGGLEVAGLTMLRTWP